MNSVTDVIISVDNCHAKNFRDGKKTVELRRRSMRLAPGTRVWIYSKLPDGRFRLQGIVKEVVKASPKALWRRFGTQTAITKREFNSYFENASTGSAILFQKIRKLSPAVKLHAMRRVSSRFNPPQFAKYLSQESPELKLLRSSKRSLA